MDDDLSRWYSPSAMFFAIIIIALLIAGVVALFRNLREKKALSSMTPNQQATYREEKLRRQEERERQARAASAEFQMGAVNPVLVCPHCQTRGKVRTKAVKKKTGISGGKATAAVLTGGLSVVAVGLSRKEGMTQAHCEHCNSTWHF